MPVPVAVPVKHLPVLPVKAAGLGAALGGGLGLKAGLGAGLGLGGAAGALKAKTPSVALGLGGLGAGPISGLIASASKAFTSAGL